MVIRMVNYQSKESLQESYSLESRKLSVTMLVFVYFMVYFMIGLGTALMPPSGYIGTKIVFATYLFLGVCLILFRYKKMKQARSKVENYVEI